MIVGEILRVVHNFNVPNASAVQNVFWYELDSNAVVDATVLTGFDTYVTDVWAEAWAVAADQNVTLETIDLDVVNLDGTVKRNIGTATIAVAGDQVTSDSTPGVVSGYLRANTALPKVNGSKYIPGFTDGLLESGLWGTTATNVLLDLLLEWLTFISIGGGDFIPGVLRRIAGAFEPFNVSGDVTDVPAYQRRRKPNVGS